MLRQNYVSLFVLVVIGAGMLFAEQATESSGRQLRHVVMFKFKETSSSEDVDRVAAAFAELPSKIEEIVDFEWGTNNSSENLNKDFTHCFLVTFANEAGREAYLPHPAHQAFVEVLKPHLDDVMVIDYWSK